MKILYFLAHPNNIGGAAKVLLKQAVIMKNLGHTVKVVIQDDKFGNHTSIYDDLCNESELDYTSLIYPISTNIEGIDIMGCLDSYGDVFQLVKDYKPDVLHSVQLNIAVELVARDSHIPHVMNIYPVLENSFDFPWENVFPQYHSSDSYFFCKKWEKGLGVISHCVRVAYERKAATLFREVKEDIKLLCIAYFTEYKNQLEIIKFIEICNNKGLHTSIRFIGNDKTQYGKKCKKYVSENNLDNLVEFVGEVPYVEKFLDESDALIHASYVESYPGVIVEAMASKIPVIVSPVGGISELVKDRENGILINGFSAQDIYYAFKAFVALHKTGKLDLIINNAFRTYKDNHSFASVGKQLCAMYQYVIDHGYNPRHIKLNGYTYYKELFQCFLNNHAECVLSQYILSRTWLLYYLEERIEKNSTALIWGTGELSEFALEICQLLNMKVLGYVDTYKSGKFKEYNIFKPNKGIILSTDYIIISATNINACSEISRYLESLHLKRNINYYFLENNPCMF